MIGNNVTANGSLTFDSISPTGNNLTLNGMVTLANATAMAPLVINVVNPGMTAAFAGTIQGASAGAIHIHKIGEGTLALGTLNGVNTINLNLAAGNLSLLNDGNGTGAREVLATGITLTNASPITAMNLTIGRSGTKFAPLFTTAANKTLRMSGFSLDGTLMLTNNHGYGLELTTETTLGANHVINVTVASGSNQIQGLTISGLVSGSTGIIKMGTGTLALTGNNTFGSAEVTGVATTALTNATVLTTSSTASLAVGQLVTGTGVPDGTTITAINSDGTTFTISKPITQDNPTLTARNVVNVLAGVVAVSSDEAMGHEDNHVLLNVNAATGAGLRATGTFDTSRTIVLNAASNAIEVTAGNVLTLNSAFGLGAVNNALRKNDNGVLEMTASNNTWTGVFTIGAGAVQVSHASALGTTAGATVVSGTGAALLLKGPTGTTGVTIAEPLTLNGTGIYGGGALSSIVAFNGTVDVESSLTTSNMVTLTATAPATLLVGSGFLGSTVTAISGTGPGTTVTLAANANAALSGGQSASYVTGNSTVTGTVTLGSAAWIGADYGTTLNLTGALSSAQALTFTGAGNINKTGIGFGAVSSITKIGSGTFTLGVTSGSFAGALVVNEGIFRIASGVSIGGTGTITLQGPSGVLELQGGLAHMSGARALTLNGGKLVINGATGSTQTLGTLTTNRSKTNVIEFNAATGANTLTFSTLVINLDSSLNFTGTLNNGSNRVAFTTTPGMTNSIIQRALVNGADFATYNGTGSTGNIQAFSAYVTNNIIDDGAVLPATPIVVAATATMNLTATPVFVGTTNRTVNALKLSGTGIDLGSGITTQGATLSLAAGAILNTGAANTLNEALRIHFNVQAYLAVAAGTTLTSNSLLTGTGGLVKDLDGTLIINAPANMAGIANISGQTLTGNFAINAGTVRLGGGNNTLTPNQFMLIAPGATLDLNGTSQFVFGIRGDGAALQGNAGTVTNSAIGQQAAFIIGADNGGFNWGGVLKQEAGAGALHFLKSSPQQYNFLNESTHSGATVFAGGVNELADYGKLTNTASIDVNYAFFRLNDNTNFVIADRVNLAADIRLRGGSLVYQGRAQTETSQSVGNVILVEGYNMIQSANGGTGINSATLNIASLRRETGSTATLRFPDNGIGAIGNVGRILIGTLNGVATSTNTGGANINSGGLTNGLIGAWAVVDREWASYIPDLGVGRLNQTGFAQYSTNTLTGTPLATDNIRLAGNVGPLLVDTTVNTLAVNPTIVQTLIDLGGKKLTLQGGGLLLAHNTLNRTLTIGNGQITSGEVDEDSDLYVHVLTYSLANSITTINANITNNGSGAVRLIMSGSDAAVNSANAANLTLNGQNTYTGGTVVNGGVLIIGSTGSILGGGITISGGFNANGSAILVQQAGGVIDSSNTVTLNGPGLLVLSGQQTLQGLVFNGSGGGTTAPTVTSAEGLLTIGAGGIVSNPFNPAATALLTGRVDLGTSLNTVTVNTFDFNGFTNFAPTTPGLIMGGLVGSSGGINKLGNGVLQVNQSSFTGALNVLEGNIQSGVFNSGSRFSTLNLSADTSLNLNGQATVWGALGGSGSVFNSVANTPTLVVGFNNSDSTFSGEINRFNDGVPNGVFLNKVGTGTMTITGTQNVLSGSSGTVTISQGTLAYTGADGRALMPTHTVQTGSTLWLDNSTSNVNNRLASPLTQVVNSVLNISGGAVRITGNSAANTSEGAIGTTRTLTLTVAQGAGTLTLEADPARSLTLALTTLSGISTGGTLLIRGLSSTAGNGLGNITVTTFTAPPGSQQNGNNGAFNKLIRPDIIVDSSEDGLGTDFATRDLITGALRALSLANNEMRIVFTNDSFGNLSLNTTGVITNGFVSHTNSLRLLSGGGIGHTSSAGYTPDAYGLQTRWGAHIINAGGGIQTQFVRTGGVLAFEGNTGITTPGFGTHSGWFYFHTIGDNSNLNISGILWNAAGGLVKSGTGTLTLGSRGYYFGSTIVNEGTLNLDGSNDALGLVRPDLTLTAHVATYTNLFMNGGKVELNGGSQMVAALTTANALPVGGEITNSSPLIEANLTANTGSGTFGGTITGNMSFTKSGNSDLILTNNNSYTGATIVRGNTLTLRDNGMLSGTSSLSVNYAVLQWDDRGLNPLANLTRVNLDASLNLQGGTFTVQGGGSLDTLIAFDNVNILGGGSIINLFPAVNAGSTIEFSIGNLQREVADHGVINFVSNVGMGGSGNNNNAQVRISIINGQAFSQDLLVNKLIGGWAVVNGNSFATYKDGVGVGELGSTVGGNAFAGGNVFAIYDGVDLSSTTTQEGWNINDSSNRTLTLSKKVNSLRSGGGTITLGGTTAVTLTLGVGWLTNAAAVAMNAGNAGSALTSSGSELFVFINQGTTTINTKITGAIDLVKSGGGVLTLANAGNGASNDYTGTTYVNQGTLNLTGAAARILIPGNLVINNATV
ncbi:MAG: autotransporter-associated beta strand repeat-containing protein, partial [Gammaproteobacteria bacterium]|nr:autotransporter-associated beta strand repeat-containing protein [Gammaproteobacteria bacterium]